MYSVKIEQLVKEYELKNLTTCVDFSEKTLIHPEVNRPALQLVGFFEYFSSERIQIIGLVEQSYISTLSICKNPFNTDSKSSTFCISSKIT